MLTRRGLLRGLGAALVTAPAIVRASSLMAVSPVDPSSLLAEMIDSEMFTTFPGGFAYRYQFGPLETIRDGVPREIAEWAQREADWLTVEVLNAGNAGNVRGGPLFA